MALAPGGTASTTTLNGFIMNTNTSPADAALVRANIKYDGALVNNAWVRVQNGQVFPGAFSFTGGSGLLHVPRRGVLQVFPGDVVAYDPNGWPILVSGWSINGGGSTGWSGL